MLKEYAAKLLEELIAKKQSAIWDIEDKYARAMKNCSNNLENFHVYDLDEEAQV